jgi:hypothetical protein
LEDSYDHTQISASASMTLSPRFDANQMSLCQPRVIREPPPNASRVGIPSARQSVAEPIFDSDFVAFRTTLLSLARDGHQLLGQVTSGRSELDSGVVTGLLRRIDQLDEQAARLGLEPMRHWVHHLRCRVLTAAAHG